MPLAAHAETISVVTSFPKELTTAYKKAYEAKYPNDKVEILNKNTSAGIAYVREQTAGARPEIFWASAPDAFEVLSNQKLLVNIGPGNPDIPAKVGNYPVNDPQGFYRGQALAGYGIMFNTRYLKANKLSPPSEWQDLLAPAWFNQVGITAPSRSGTMHLTVETILQSNGWNAGWNTLLRMSGNSAAVTERSFGVPDGVSNGQFGAGPVIDFFGLSAKYSGFPVEFVYPVETAIVPANIALVAGAKNPEAGKKFITFTLSQAGQEILLQPKVSRLPVLPYRELTSKVPANYPDPNAIAARSTVKFDTELSAARYEVVLKLFDQTITFRLKELQAATKAIFEAERKLKGATTGSQAELLAQARTLAYTPLVDDKQISDVAFLKIFSGNKKDPEVSKAISQFESDWNARSKERYERALELAKKAAQ
jgi:ABC-type Fe3+ transport system substrate-binding protein